MNANLLGSTLGLILLAVAAGADPPPPKNNDNPPAERAGMQILEQNVKKLAQEYEQGKKQFSAARDKATGVLVSRFDTVEKKLRANMRLAAELRTAKVKKVITEKSAFMANGALPASDEMLGSLLEYQEAIYKAQFPVAKSYEQLFTSTASSSKTTRAPTD